MTIYDYVNKGDFIKAIMIGNSACDLTIGKLYEVTNKNQIYIWIYDDCGRYINIGKDSTAAKDWFELPSSSELNVKDKDIDFLDLLKGY